MEAGKQRVVHARRVVVEVKAFVPYPFIAYMELLCYRVQVGARIRTTNITFYCFQILWNISYNQIFTYMVNLLKSI